MKPVTQERIQMIDAIRGFALVGLPFVNVIALWLYHLQINNTNVDISIQRFLSIFVEGRFHLIFSFLFGLGVYLFLTRVKEKQEHYMQLYIRRMLILLAVGIIHQFFQPGEALAIYAIFSFLLLPFTFLPRKWNLYVGIIGVILGSIWHAKAFLPLPSMILGLALGQYRLFEMYRQHMKKWILTFIISTIGTICLSVYLWMAAPSLGYQAYIPGQNLTVEQADANQLFYAFEKLSAMFAPIYTVSYISFIVIFSSLLSKLLSYLAALGRMAFTNYVMQTIMLLFVLQYMIKTGIASYTYSFLTCLIIIMIQLIYSFVWFTYFKYGPLEWLWRCGTYRQMLSIKK